MADISNITLPDGVTYNVYDANVPHTSIAASSGGVNLSLVTTGEKYTWNNKPTTLAGLTDTNISSTAKSNQPLVYNASSAKWINSSTVSLISLSVKDTNDVVRYSVTSDGTNNIYNSNGKLCLGTSTTATGGSLYLEDPTASTVSHKVTLSSNGNGGSAYFKNASDTLTVSISGNGGSVSATTIDSGLQADDITIASGDKLVVTDSSASNKVRRTGISFDTSVTTRCLTRAGTWASFTNNAGTVTGSGTANYLAKWSSGSAIGNALAYSSGSATAVRCNILNGGYITLGSYVFLDICFTLTSAINNSASIVSGLPTPKYNSNISIVGTVLGDAQETTYGFRVVSGSLYANGNRSNGGGWHVFGSYVKA